jgi:succinate dehydrogenase / fumarate reductase cytochrome b subunit
MALSGLAMVGFLVAHLSGNLLVFLGPGAIDAYAAKLRDFPVVLWGLRLGLIGATVLHIYSGVRLTQASRAGRPVGYAGASSPRAAGLGSRTMALTGAVVLGFIVFHLAHLTLRWTDPRFLELGHFEVYRMLCLSFSSPLLTLFYGFSVLALCLHLSHGVTSVFQTLGLRTAKNRGFLCYAGPILAGLLGVGFLAGPLAIFFGFIS